MRCGPSLEYFMSNVLEQLSAYVPEGTPIKFTVSLDLLHRHYRADIAENLGVCVADPHENTQCNNETQISFTIKMPKIR